MIGIFDSGLGGLTALRELRALCPEADIIYFGDTGRAPYGTRSREAVVRYARQDLDFLLSLGVARVLAACGTVSSVALTQLEGCSPVPVTGVVKPAAFSAVNATKNGRVGVIGTGVTISSKSFVKAITRLDDKIQITATACPLLVPLVENGFIGKDCEITRLAVRGYIEPIKASGADTLILGCTHYPIIADIIAEELPGVNLINSGAAAADFVASQGVAKESGKTEIYISDEGQNFRRVARTFLGCELPCEIKKIDIDEL